VLSADIPLLAWQFEIRVHSRRLTSGSSSPASFCQLDPMP
jgi:hypothetical protein